LIYDFLIHRSRRHKLLFWFASDVLLVPISIYLAYALRLDTPVPYLREPDFFNLILLTVLAGIVLVYVCRLPWIKLREFDANATIRAGVCTALLVLAIVSFGYFFKLSVPRSVPIIFGVLFFLLTTVVRILGMYILDLLKSYGGRTVSVAIYGAGAAGIQLVSALRKSREVEPAIFVDDNPALHGLVISGLKILKPEKLFSLVKVGRINRLIIAMPSLPVRQQKEIAKKMSQLPCDIRILPSFVDMIVSNKALGSQYTVSPEDLLGRSKVDLNGPQISRTYSGRVVMVTGAGGSIGSELCRQLLFCNPSCIVLFDISEYALYEIEAELRQSVHGCDVLIIARLGSVTDANRVEEVLQQYQVDVIIHAAAYKHVPLVEVNPFEGVRNNVIGTAVLTSLAAKAEIECFVLISTDKAVRPANVMGGSKRMAELIVQDAAAKKQKTRFSMVRFGNVLGSSGSVVPLFKRQIQKGGPVTVTHPEVTRFFMTIPEAVGLVLLAGSYTNDGNVFVLDMGEPVKIFDLAKHLIELSGSHIRETSDPMENGGIEIRFTGLRPGEKLYEELLIDDDTLVATPHPKILSAKEAQLSPEKTEEMIVELKNCIDNHNIKSLYKTLERYIEGYDQSVIKPIKRNIA